MDLAELVVTYMDYKNCEQRIQAANSVCNSRKKLDETFALEIRNNGHNKFDKSKPEPQILFHNDIH